MSPTLDTLPPEILFSILSYTSPFSTLLLPNHPLYTTAATSKHLCSTVEEYCRGLLKCHADKTPPKSSKRNTFVCRRKWIKWVKETCALCGKGSKRKAILDAGMTCCKQCDDKNFPKMTQTAAIKDHGLSKLDLFTPNVLYPHLPPLVLGTYVCMGGDTLMISESSVLERKSQILKLLTHGEEDYQDGSLLRRRAGRHHRFLQLMNSAYVVSKCEGRWVRTNREQNGMSNKMVDAYVKEFLGKEWRSMRKPLGSSADSAIEIDD